MGCRVALDAADAVGHARRVEELIMRRILSVGLLACAMQFVACRALSTTSPVPPDPVRVELSDGSSLGLVPSVPSFGIRSEFATMAVPWASVTAAESGSPSWTLQLRNGDRVRGAPADRVLSGNSALGRVRIPFASIKALASSRAQPVARPAPTGVVHAIVSLRDGSSIRAEPGPAALRVQSAVLGTIEIGPSELRSLDLDGAQSRAVLLGGDRIVGTVTTPSLAAGTALGDLTFPMDRIAGIRFLTAAPAGVLPDGLVAHYPLDEPGDDVRDASGNGNDGKATGTRFSPEGAVGGCHDFSGGPAAGDFIRVPHSASLVSMQTTRELTVCAWIRPRTIPASFPVILGKGGNHKPDCFGGYELMINAHGDNDLAFVSALDAALYTHQSGGRHVNSRVGRWIHVALAIRSQIDASDFAFYVDGERSPFSAADSGLTGRNARFDLPNDLFIGGPDPRSHPNRAFFDGWIDEVMIFNRRLTDEDIRDLFRRRAPAPDAPPADSRRAQGGSTGLL